MAKAWFAAIKQVQKKGWIDSPVSTNVTTAVTTLALQTALATSTSTSTSSSSSTRTSSTSGSNRQYLSLISPLYLSALIVYFLYT